MSMPKPQQLFGPYQIVVSVDAGGMGEVFWVGDTRLNRDVAVKVLLVAGETCTNP